MNTGREFSRPKNYVYSLSDEIEQTSFMDLVSMYNMMREDDFLTIYLFSPGGSLHFAASIVDLINENCDKTFLIAHGEICSAAFDIFFKSMCERKILPGTSGMAHVARTFGLPVVKDNQPLDETGAYYKKWGMEEFKKRIAFYKDLGLTKPELKIVSDNKDAWFTESRLRTFLRNSIKNINAGYQ